MRTSRGRMATQLTYDYFGLKAGKKTRPTSNWMPWMTDSADRANGAGQYPADTGLC